MIQLTTDSEVKLSLWTLFRLVSKAVSLYLQTLNKNFQEEQLWLTG